MHFARKPIQTNAADHVLGQGLSKSFVEKCLTLVQYRGNFKIRRYGMEEYKEELQLEEHDFTAEREAQEQRRMEELKESFCTDKVYIGQVFREIAESMLN